MKGKSEREIIGCRIISIMAIFAMVVNGLAIVNANEDLSDNMSATRSDDPVALWHFDEGSGQVASDSSGNGNDGELGSSSGSDESDPTWVDGIDGKALQFDGVDDYVDISGSSNLLNSPSSITLAAWIKIKKVGTSIGSQILSKRHSNNEGSFTIYVEDYPFAGINIGKLACSIDNPGYNGHRYSTTYVDDDKWHFVAGVKDGTVINVYVDGNLENTVTDTTAISTSSSNWHIGHQGAWGSYFNGIIDEVAIYGRALTPEEIKER